MRAVSLAFAAAGCVATKAPGRDVGADAGAPGLPDGGAGAADGGSPATTCNVPHEALVDAWVADPSACVVRWAGDVPGARGIAFAPGGDLFAVSRYRALLVLWDADGDGVSGAGERSVFAENGGNHGLALHEGHAYVSTDTTVLRYPYAAGDRVARGPARTVVRDMPAGGHTTRTLAFDRDGRLVVSAGSGSNVDPASLRGERAVLRRFDLSRLPEAGLAWREGEVFAAGLRNEVGVRPDPQGRLWGVENGRDGLTVAGEDIHDDNPAEEVNLFETAGAFYGYPFCWTAFLWRGHGPAGTQHADPEGADGRDDAWCRDPANNVPPAGVLPAHLAPLDLWFYSGALFPGLRGRMLVTAHGSWNRQPAVGRTLLSLTVEDGRVTAAEPFLGGRSSDGSLAQGTWEHRPVGLAEAPDGTIFFSDDLGGTILKIGRR